VKPQYGDIGVHQIAAIYSDRCCADGKHPIRWRPEAEQVLPMTLRTDFTSQEYFRDLVAAID
jgi:hypothetical protein